MNLGPNERLERCQWDFFWVPDDAETLERPDVAAVRCPRPTAVLNSVTRTRAGSDHLDGLIGEMEGFLGRPACWAVPDTFDTAPLESALQRAGWRRTQRYEARAIEPEAYQPSRPPRSLSVRRIETLTALEDAEAVLTQAFDSRGPVSSKERLAADLAACAPSDGRVHRFVVYDAHDRPIASAGFNWYPDLRLAFLWGGGTIPEARRQGAYSALVAARLSAARELGAEWTGVYAREETSAPIVARHGFALVGERWDWLLTAARG